MTWNEWIQLVQVRQALWDRFPVPDEEALRVQYEFVKATPYDVGYAAVRALASNEFPPNSAAIAQRAMELSTEPEPDFDEVVAAFRVMVSKSGGQWGANSAPRRDDWIQRGYHERTASFFDTSRWRLWCQTPGSDGTFYAQQRDEYRAARGRHESELRLLAAGVDRAQLERPNNRPQLRKPGFGELVGLPSPSDAPSTTQESDR